jgi:hypothetical protein
MCNLNIGLVMIVEKRTGLRNVNPFNASTSSVIVALIRKDWKSLGRKDPEKICRTSVS